jgi:hypothetical protein
VAWVAALFATNSNGGLWALAWMFPLGLAAFIDPHWGNSGGWGVFCGLYRRLPHSRLVLFSFAKRAHHTFSIRHPCDSVHLQRFGVPGDD